MRHTVMIAAVVALLGGCATQPVGPRVTTLPPAGKPYDVFVGEERYCQDRAAETVRRTYGDAAARDFVGSAALGTAIGALAGAAVGGHQGAGGGAAAGLVVGSMIGAGNADGDRYMAQRQYDTTYAQCMASQGNLPPAQGYRGAVLRPPAPAYPPPYPAYPSAAYPPPPPPR